MAVMFMGLPEKREEKDQGRNADTDTETVGEGLTGVGWVAAKEARDAKHLIHRRRAPCRRGVAQGRASMRAGPKIPTR